MSKMLEQVVAIQRQFLRSVRVDADWGREDALTGFVIQPSARTSLESMARQIAESRQRAFTWTGPYGGGKSSLALALSAYAGGTPSLRRQAKEALQIDVDSDLARAFGSRAPWLVLPVVGKREPIRDVIGAVLDSLAPTRGRKPTVDGKRDVIAELLRQAESGRYGGVLLVLDELGKFLESSTSTGDDIYFYQELAEKASRSSGQLVVLGVLHQAFEQYAAKLGREAREEWAKVQGRFVDIPIIAGSDELIELIGRAIECADRHTPSRAQSKTVADVIHTRRPASSRELPKLLDKCWPLHPVTAALLGPSSKRRFGQNERSIFGFLSSAEPLGFKSFISSTPYSPDVSYVPSMYWDYLRTNLEPAILSSSDGHRWAQGAEAVERAEAKHSKLHVDLVKTVALIEMFRNGSGVAAEQALLASCFPEQPASAVEQALANLSRASILIFRKHLNAWGVFAGSDFDIEAGMSRARASLSEPDGKRLTALASLPPVSARRHYWVSGNLRWLTRTILRAAEAKAHTKMAIADGGAIGELAMLLPGRDLSEQQALRLAKDLSAEETGATRLFGIPRNAQEVNELALDVLALEYLRKTQPELEGDAIARREIDARLQTLRAQLEESLASAFIGARWYWKGERQNVSPSEGLPRLASDIADRVYEHAPHFQSELINRDALSTNAVKARRDLLHRMLNRAGEENLGYEGFPADAGLYYSVVKPFGLHRHSKHGWRFADHTDSRIGGTLTALWGETLRHLKTSKEPIKLNDLYVLWRRAPYGLKLGMMPVLAVAFFLSHKHHLAGYIDEMFVPELTDAHLDEWLQDPTRVTWRYIHVDSSEKRFLELLSSTLADKLKRPMAPDALDSARGLVSVVYELPQWTRRTTRVSAQAQQIRDLLLHASDPHKVLFADIPATLNASAADVLVSAIVDVIGELTECFPKMLLEVKGSLLRAIDHHGPYEALRARAKTVSGISGDFRLDAFATRLSEFHGTDEELIGIISLASNRPSQEWTDHDINAALMQVGQWALEFRRVEVLAAFGNRPATRKAIAVVFGTDRTVSDTFDVADSDAPQIEDLVSGLLAQMVAGNVRREVFLAALAEAGTRVLAGPAAKHKKKGDPAPVSRTLG